MWIMKSLHLQVTQAFSHSSCDALAVLAPFYPVHCSSLYFCLVSLSITHFQAIITLYALFIFSVTLAPRWRHHRQVTGMTLRTTDIQHA
jgi:tRNA isopentenyl-2-thiomethyl-A-37 hydroxylase MiaE